jgi:hypothetical protein
VSRAEWARPSTPNAVCATSQTTRIYYSTPFPLVYLLALHPKQYPNLFIKLYLFLKKKRRKEKKKKKIKKQSTSNAACATSQTTRIYYSTPSTYLLAHHPKQYPIYLKYNI